MKRTANILSVIAFALAFIVGCAPIPVEKKQPKTVAAAAETPPAAPAVHSAWTFGELVTRAIDHIADLASKINPADPQRQPVIDATNDARQKSVDAQKKVAAAEGVAAAKDSEAKADRAALAKANTEIVNVTNDRNTIAGRLNDAMNKIQEIENSKILLALWLGIAGCIILAAAGGYFLTIPGNVWRGVGMIAAGVTGITVCILAMNIQHFAYTHETEIGYGALGLALAGLCVGGYFAFRRMHESTIAATKIIQSGIVTGAVNFDKLTPIANTLQTPTLAAIVDRNTSPTDRAAASAHFVLPTMSLNDTSTNVAAKQAA